MQTLPAPSHPVETAAPENLALGSLAELTARSWAARQLVRAELAAGCTDSARLALRTLYAVMAAARGSRLHLYRVLVADAARLQAALSIALADEVA
ncbi:hypothetical protein [Salinarimonas sp.]|uniref:hypothetical protein n=1 Tax=Salinarimonas sp. TaxID=2766526 RepID=UPI00391A78DB